MMYSESCMSSASIHTAVLPAEVMEFLAVEPGMTVVDGTLGGGGHTRLLLDAVGTAGRVIALDRDPAAIDRGARELAGRPIRFAQANFCDLPEALDALSIDRVDRVLLDVGLSSDQLADHDRGFSFDSDGPLDLRFDPTEGEPAWRMVNRLRPETLADIIYEFGEERRQADRRRAGTVADSHVAGSRPRGDGRRAPPKAAAADPSRHAHLPGAADRRQPGAQEPADRPGADSHAPRAGRQACGDLVPLAGGSPGEGGVSESPGLEQPDEIPHRSGP